LQVQNVLQCIKLWCVCYREYVAHQIIHRHRWRRFFKRARLCTIVDIQVDVWWWYTHSCWVATIQCSVGEIGSGHRIWWGWYKISVQQTCRRRSTLGQSVYRYW
jgi:hypothetical protein